MPLFPMFDYSEEGKTPNNVRCRGPYEVDKSPEREPSCVPYAVLIADFVEDRVIGPFPLSILH
jgi:hypothetical protein